MGRWDHRISGRMSGQLERVERENLDRSALYLDSLGQRSGLLYGVASLAHLNPVVAYLQAAGLGERVPWAEILIL